MKKSTSNDASCSQACGLRCHSSQVTDGVERAASRAMLHAVGFTDADFRKPQVGVASTWSMVTPCNMHIDKLARYAAQGVDGAGGKAVIFGTITISDGISMGTEGMKYSLVSREIIADSIEAVVGCEGFDGVVAIGPPGVAEGALGELAGGAAGELVVDLERAGLLVAGEPLPAEGHHVGLGVGRPVHVRCRHHRGAHGFAHGAVLLAAEKLCRQKIVALFGCIERALEAVVIA